MKAIIITFHGEAPEKNYDEIIRKMAELVFNNTSTKIEDISAAILDDKEVSEALLQKIVMTPTTNTDKASLTPNVKIVSELCSNIINEIGTPSLMNEEVFRKDLLKYLLNEEDKKFITDFYKYSFDSIVLNCIDNGMHENPGVIVAKVSRLITGTIDHACLSVN